ncbi:hypothetical protein DENIS_3267 [Desulfonema ishimotonii]|uniref:DUF4435 domain-containing protein n=1 Tax=Desulfonema ishimotonii TaxID=45657 RepID=A0A401FZB6_9BACT|nr:hypothetical protein [Desulfonema ishimotonii]GBC62298.1 hypothetical protein DENIS_3267 [Desulfonema ishimotonii]
MIQRYFIVEGESDQFLLKKLLPSQVVSTTKFIIGGGYAAAISKARSVLVSTELPVILALDSDTTDRQTVEEKKDYLFQILSQVSAPEKFHIFLFVPEIEGLFFENRLLAEKIFDRIPEYAALRPKKTLTELFETDSLRVAQNRLESRLTGPIIEQLRESGTIKDIICKINI